MTAPLSTTVETPTPVAETPKPSSILQSLSDSQRETWLKTGDLPSAPESAAVADTPAPAADEAETAETDPEASPVETASEKPLGKPRSDMRARLGQLAEQRDREKARAEAAEKRAADLEAKLSGTPAAAEVTHEPAPVVASPDEPKIEDFLETPDPYAALAKATAKWELAKYKQELAAESAHRAVVSKVQEIQAKGHEKYPDWDARMLSVDKTVLLPPATVQLLHESEFSVDVLYHLSKHPAEVRALAAMEPLAAAKTLGSLEARLSGASSRPAAKPTSDAPPPPTTLGQKPAAPSDDLDEALRARDTGRYIELANARELAAMKAGRR